MTCIVDRGTMISHKIKIVCPIFLSKGHAFTMIMIIAIPSMEFHIYPLELRVC